jgi:hypothetical protein
MTSTRFDDPDELDDLEFLKKAADILFNLDQTYFGVPPGSKDGKPRCVIIAENDLAWWEGCRTAVLRACGNIGKCPDLRCRRRKCCQKLNWVTSNIEALHKRLAAMQATWSTVKPTSNPSPEHKKGRTGVRP